MSDAKNPGYLMTVLSNKCPRCREGHLFVSKNAFALKNNEYIKMHEQCPVCGQPTDIEVGFYYGTSFVSYALVVVLSGLSFVLWWLLFGFSIDDNRIFWWLGINAFLMLALQTVFMRLSRTLWLSWFVKYDPEWPQHEIPHQERVIKEHMGNW